MQDCTIHSMALALLQAALGPSEGQQLSVGCFQPSGGSLHLESISVSGDANVGLGGRIEAVGFRDD